jgi:hypothetical protein
MEGILEKGHLFLSFSSSTVLPFSLLFQLFFVSILYTLFAFPFMPLFPLSSFLPSESTTRPPPTALLLLR